MSAGGKAFLGIPRYLNGGTCIPQYGTSTKSIHRPALFTPNATSGSNSSRTVCIHLRVIERLTSEVNDGAKPRSLHRLVRSAL